MCLVIFGNFRDFNAKWLNISLKQKLCDQFQQQWRSDVFNFPKLKPKCYKLFKDCFEFENYLNVLADKDLKLLCKFRTGNHRLPIEIGRWQGIERHNRICTLCNSNEIGDEYHYILQCPSLNQERREFLGHFYMHRINVIKFCQLFQSKNKPKLRNLCKFIKVVLTKTCPPG